MPVNLYILYGPDGMVVVDSMLTVSDATSVRDAARASGRTMAGVVVTHPVLAARRDAAHETHGAAGSARLSPP